MVDNFETISDSALVEWLLRLPEPSKALVTSREARCEFWRNSWPVELDGLNQAEARQFLLEKVSSLKMERLVGEITQLDPLLAATGGNPKALELALGYLKYSHQGLAQVVADLEAARGEIFDDLFRRNWETLGDVTRRVLMVLPLFSAPALGQSLAVTAGISPEESGKVLAHLTGLGLVDLQKTGLNSPPRYGLHPLVRAFAEARLAEKTEFERLARPRQLEWYIELASQVGYCWDDLDKLKMLDPEQETLHSLILWSAENERYDYLSRLIREVDYYYHIRGLWKGQPSLSYLRVEAAAKTGDRIEETNALAYFIQTLCRQQRLEEARPALERLAALNSSLVLPDEGLFEVAYTLGMFNMASQDYPKSIEQWQNSLPLARRVSVRAYTVARGHLAICFYRQGQPNEAEALWQAILEEAPASGFLRGAISSRIGLARLRLDKAELAAARVLLEEAASLAANYQDRERAAEIDALLARYYLLLGDTATAGLFGARALDVFERLGMRYELTEIRGIVVSSQ